MQKDDVTEVKLGKTVVVMDSKNLEFNEVTIDRYQEEEAGWYNYFGQRLAEALVAETGNSGRQQGQEYDQLNETVVAHALALHHIDVFHGDGAAVAVVNH